MESGQIPNSQISASTTWSGYNPYKARLNSQSGWYAATQDVHQWLQVDFGKLVKVTGIATQSYYNSGYRVKSYTLSYSNTDFDAFTPYQQQSFTKTFTGNTDANGIVTNSLNPAIIARFIRINPQSWYGYIALRVEFYGCTSGYSTPKVLTCLNPLGIESGQIPDSQIRASTVDGSYYPYKARLNSQSGWIASTQDTHQWLQVDLGSVTKVTGIATQSYYNNNYYVTSYTLSYSNTGFDAFTPYQQQSFTKIFSGNVVVNTVVKHLISPAIIARFMRINPQKWYTYVSMRIELYGCTSGFPTPKLPTCLNPLGMENGRIPNSQISASTISSSHYPYKARLYSQEGWMASTQDTQQWLQVDFGSVIRVTGIATQSYYNYNYYVTSYTLSYSNTGFGAFTPYQQKSFTKIFAGNTNMNTVVKHLISPAISARFIRINPQKWYTYISLRTELYGCTSGDGGYSAWGEWSQCSSRCGSGTRTRSRTCSNPPPSTAGKDCSGLGPSHQTEACGSGNCTGLKTWIPVGCFYNKGNAVGKSLRALSSNLSIRRKFLKCKYAASRQKESLFGLDDQTCWIGKNPTSASFDAFGTSVLCTSGRLRAGFRRSKTVFIYQKDNNGVWKSLGCYNNESPTRALPNSFDQNVSSVSGPDAIFDYCKAKAEASGYKLFGADDANCWSGVNAAVAENSYNKYGPSTQCSISSTTGRGSGTVMNGDMYVYKLK